MNDNGKNLVRSKFKKNEKFGLENIPKHFESVTNKSINRTKTACLRRIEREHNGKFNAQTLRPILESVNGQFGEAYKTLEGDYGTRVANLKDVYHEGVAELKRDFKNFQLDVDKHEAAYQRFSEISEKLDGRPISENLRFSQKDLIEMENTINGLEERK